MTVQQLKYILKVAEVGSITEAAKLLFISQPSLSNSIKDTEKEAGITIFLRSRTGTHQILDDVKNRVCDLGILYLSHENEVVMRKAIEENHLVFTELFSAKPHVFLQKDHPLASKKVVSIHDLAPYPRLNFVQGEYESVYFSEELFSSIPVDKKQK